MLAEQPPAMSATIKEAIACKVKEAMANGVDLQFWAATITSQPPTREDSESETTEDGDTVPPAKRQRIPETQTEGGSSHTKDVENSNPVCSNDTGEAQS
jgi:hypothetical protein